MNLTTLVIAVGAAVLLSALSRIFSSGRSRELSPSGAPQLRHVAVPHLLAIFAVGLLWVATWQWSELHAQGDRVRIAVLVVGPAVLGFLVAVGAALAFRYTVTLEPNEIIVRELFSNTSYPLDILERTENFENKITLHFSDGRHLTLHKDLSGFQHFVASLAR